MHLAVATYNIDGWTATDARAHETAVARDLDRMQADFVGLNEVLAASGQVERLARSLGYAHWGEIRSYPHHSPGLALGFLSRVEPLEVRAVPALRARQGWHDCLLVRLAGGKAGRPWSIFCAHWWNMDQIGKPVAWIARSELWRANPRTHQARHLLMLHDESPGPLVLLGDLNTFPYSRAYRLLRASLLDGCPMGQRWRGTYRHRGWRPHLDHIFHSADLQTMRYRIGPGGASDHRPVTALLRERPGLA